MTHLEVPTKIIKIQPSYLSGSIRYAVPHHGKVTAHGVGIVDEANKLYHCYTARTRT